LNGHTSPSPVPIAIDTRTVELGNLLKAARKNTQVPEFDISDFTSPTRTYTNPSSPDFATPYVVTPQSQQSPVAPGIPTKTSSSVPELKLSDPATTVTKEQKVEEKPKPKGLGTFMKASTQPAQVPEFDMGSFF
jgi:hypothetical protein